MVLAIVLLTCQLGSDGAFSKFVMEINGVALEHSTAFIASNSDASKEEITKKNNERLQELTAKEIVRRMSFEYRIQSMDRNANGDFSVILDPIMAVVKTDPVNTRSLTIPIKKEQGETLFTGDLLAFSGKLKTGADPRSKNALPFAVVRPAGLKQIAIWIDEIEIGESKPKVKEGKEFVSEVVTPKMFVTDIDRIFKQAKSEVERGKTTADEQDSADKQIAIILKAVQGYDGEIFEFETTIKDVLREGNKDDLKVIVSHSELLQWFVDHSAPLRTSSRDLSFFIVEEDRNEFTIGRKLIVRAKISAKRAEAKGAIGSGRPSELLATVEVYRRWIGSRTPASNEQYVVLRLQDITTEFLPDKKEPMRTKQTNQNQRDPGRLQNNMK